MAQVIISQLPPLPNGTGSGTPKGTDLTPATDPTDTTEAATGTTKKYTRAAENNFLLASLGYRTIAAVRVATTTALTATYGNGALGVGATLTNSGAMVALTVDSVAVAVGDRVLVQNQAAPAQNGIYTVTTVGSGATNWVLTRATDYDVIAEIMFRDMILVNQGTVNGGLYFFEASPSPTVMGTSAITFEAFSFSNSVFVWELVSGTSATMTANTGYVSGNAGLVTLTLPATSNFGDEIAVSGSGAGGWLIAQNAGQSVHIGSSTSTVGVGGSVASTNRYDSLRLVCTVGNTEWSTTGAPQGILTVV